MKSPAKDENEFVLLTPEEARKEAWRFNFDKGVLTYILWDITESANSLPARPLYVGTAKAISRIYGHANKNHGDNKQAIKSNHPEFATHIKTKADTHGLGWLRLTLRKHRNYDAAQKDERA